MAVIDEGNVHSVSIARHAEGWGVYVFRVRFFIEIEIQLGSKRIDIAYQPLERCAMTTRCLRFPVRFCDFHAVRPKGLDVGTQALGGGSSTVSCTPPQIHLLPSYEYCANLPSF